MSEPYYNTYTNIIKSIRLILFIVLGISPLLFAQEPNPDIVGNRGYTTYKEISETKKGTVIVQRQEAADVTTKKQEDLSELQKQARIYRGQGLELQRIGNLEGAMSLYQKATELDPAYAVAHNDLGIVYEAKGLIDRAEDSYLKSIKVAPNFLSAYSNLALLYENKRDLEKALIFWKKRAELGSPDDPWTKKAKQRFEDICLVSGQKSIVPSQEQEVIDLMKDTQAKKSILRQDNKALARKHFEKAKQSYDKQDYATAIKEALDAQQLDPTNIEIKKFIEKAQLRALSR